MERRATKTPTPEDYEFYLRYLRWLKRLGGKQPLDLEMHRMLRRCCGNMEILPGADPAIFLERKHQLEAKGWERYVGIYDGYTTRNELDAMLKVTMDDPHRKIIYWGRMVYFFQPQENAMPKK